MPWPWSSYFCSWTGCRSRIRAGAKYCKGHSKQAWKQRNPDKVKAARDRRKALERGAKTAEVISRDKVFRRDKRTCGICGKKIRGEWELDHVKPLSKGGSHTYENVQASHPWCNRKKGAKES